MHKPYRDQSPGDQRENERTVANCRKRLGLEPLPDSYWIEQGRKPPCDRMSAVGNPWHAR